MNKNEERRGVLIYTDTKSDLKRLDQIIAELGSSICVEKFNFGSHSRYFLNIAQEEELLITLSINVTKIVHTDNFHSWQMYLLDVLNKHKKNYSQG